LTHLIVWEDHKAGFVRNHNYGIRSQFVLNDVFSQGTFTANAGQGLIGLIDDSGQGLTSLIDDTGQGVVSTI